MSLNKRKCFFLFSLLMISLICFGQKESNIWYFGVEAGLDFNSGTPVPLTDGVMHQFEGCASIADTNGSLLFYTDGDTIWNKSHAIMTNGTGLQGHKSSTQSAIIVPKPASDSLYYIFTVDPANNFGPNGLSYSEVDMSMSGGNGAITSNKNITLHTPTCEKLVATMHSNGTDIWIVTHAWNSDAFYAHLITQNGINSTPVISNSGAYIGGNPNQISHYMGYMKISPDGSKLAAVHYQYNETQLFSFDNSTGIVSNPITVQDNYQGNGPYGCEFSPSGEYLYVSTSLSSGYIHQYDLNASNITTSEILIATMPSVGSMIQIGLQLGPDNKIYSTRNGTNVPFGGYPYASVINSPDSSGSKCNYVQDQLYLNGKNVNMGFPPLIVTHFGNISFTYDSLCIGDSVIFNCSNSGATQTSWDFGDPASGSENNASGNSVKHSFSAAGTYTITMQGNLYGNVKTHSETIVILSSPVISLEDTLYICEGSTVNLDATILNGTYLWNDSSTTATLTVGNSGTYSVYVTDSNGCESNKNIEILTEECGDKAVYLPSAFSPNNDGVNDILYVRGTGIRSIELLIYNRFGELVFKSDNINNGWDGTFRGKALNNAVFMHKLNTVFYDGEQKQLFGNISLLK